MSHPFIHVIAPFGRVAGKLLDPVPMRLLTSRVKSRMSVVVVVLIAKSCLTLSGPHGPQPSRLLCPWDFPGKHTGVSCHLLL